ncbi:MAG: hypothetical protein QM765_02545 [Myxococcales bacterium]
MIVAEHGWPTREVVGEDGAFAALNLLFDSHDVALKQELLPTLLAAAKRGQIPGEYVAKLVDVSAVKEGKQQTYGASWHRTPGNLVTDPIEDPQNVDARRKSIGLRPLDEYLAQFER